MQRRNFLLGTLSISALVILFNKTGSERILNNSQISLGSIKHDWIQNIIKEHENTKNGQKFSIHAYTADSVLFGNYILPQDIIK
jgi:hypothetical protein